MNDRSKRLRLAIWVLAAVGAGPGQVIWLEWMQIDPQASFGWRLPAGYAAIVGCLVVILALLYTTPLDAIRLPRWISELLIVGVIISLMLPGMDFLPATIGRLLFTVPGLILLRVHNKSPWWATAIGWFPMVH